MTTSGPDLLARLAAYHQALQPFDAAKVAAFFAPDATYHSPGIGRPLSGRDEIVAAFSSYFARFPNQISTDDRIEVTGPLSLRSHWRLVATDQETGQTVERQGTEDFEFAPSGLIARVVVHDSR